MSAILLDSSIVHYEVLGRGRPVIFLHSWVGSWRYWINAMQVASTSFRAYALDLWGFGDTAHNILNYSLEQQTSLIDRFLDGDGDWQDRFGWSWTWGIGGDVLCQPLPPKRGPFDGY